MGCEFVHGGLVPGMVEVGACLVLVSLVICWLAECRSNSAGKRENILPGSSGLENEVEVMTWPLR